MKPHPETIELDEQALQAKLDQIEAALGAEIVEPLRQLLSGYISLLAMLREKNVSIRRLRKLIFGGSSERSSKIMPADDSSSEAAADTGDEGEGATAAQAEGADDQTESEQGDDPSSPGVEPSSGPAAGKGRKRPDNR